MLRISKKELIELYTNQKLSLLEIARLYGYANESCIAYIRDKYGIPPRSQGEIKKGKHCSPKTEFKKGLEPWNKGKDKNNDLRLAKISQAMKNASWNKGLTKETDPRLLAQGKAVSRALKGGTHRDAQYAFGRKFYENLYRNQGISLQAIADKLGCDISTVYYYFKKYQIPRRKGFEAVRRKPTAPELKLAAIIERYGLPYRYVGDGAIWIESCNPDFINIDGAKGIIELFGTYWHTTKIKKWRDTESGRAYRYAEYGFKTLVIWENELKDEKAVVKKIKKFDKTLKAGIL